MAVTVKIPTQLRAAAGGAGAVDGRGRDRRRGARRALRPSTASCATASPTRTAALRRFVNVYVGGEDIRFLDGLETAVPDGAEVQILPAVAGGSLRTCRPRLPRRRLGRSGSSPRCCRTGHRGRGGHARGSRGRRREQPDVVLLDQSAARAHRPRPRGAPAPGHHPVRAPPATATRARAARTPTSSRRRRRGDARRRARWPTSSRLPGKRTPADARADAGGVASARRRSSSRSTTRRGCTGTCGSSTTACSPPSRSPTRCRRAGRQPDRGPHRGPPARVPRLPRRDPEGRVRRRDDDDLGPRAPTRCSSGSRTQGRGRAARRAGSRGPLRAVPDRAATAKDWMIHRMDPPADPAARADARAARRRCSPRPATLPADDDGLGVRDQVGRRARDRVLRAGPAALRVAQPATTSPRAIPSWRG